MRRKTEAEKNAELPMSSDIAHTYGGFILVEYRNSNANGDLNAGGNPRIDPITSQAIVSGESVRRMVRDYWLVKYQCEPPFNVYMRNRETMIREDGGLMTLDDMVQQARKSVGLGLNPVYAKALEQAQKGKQKGSQKAATKGELDARQQRVVRTALGSGCIDVRVFGAMLAVGSDRIDSLRMPFTIHDGLSINPVVELDIANTRAMVSSEKEKKSRGRSIANRVVHRYALVKHEFTLSPNSAAISGMSMRDLYETLEALINGWPQRTGPHRKPVLRGLWLVEQPRLGRRPPGLDWSDIIEVRCKLDEPIEADSFRDFEITVHQDLVPPGVRILDLNDVVEMIGLHDDTQEAAE